MIVAAVSANVESLGNRDFESVSVDYLLRVHPEWQQTESSPAIYGWGIVKQDVQFPAGTAENRVGYIGFDAQPSRRFQVGL